MSEDTFVVVEGRVKKTKEGNEMDIIMQEIAWQMFRMNYGNRVLSDKEKSDI